jgi:hypothetical protein
MALSAFDDKASAPTAAELASVLGRASGAWSSLKESLLAECRPLTEVWSFAGKAFGWSLRLKRDTRIIVYMTPCRGYFLASFVLGEKACLAAREARLLPSVLELIESAPKYAEGRGVRIPVRNKKECASIRTLAAIKLAH